MNRFFVEALDLREHPVKKARMNIQAKYIAALAYIIERTLSEANSHQAEIGKYATEHLRLYQKLFADTAANVKQESGSDCLSALAKSWRSKYRFMLVCDAALILLDERLLLRAASIIKERMSAWRQTDVVQLSSLLRSKQEVGGKYRITLPLLNQYRANNDFFSKKERRIIVTANMSAGKSTLINALAGKQIARTSQEVCTGNVCYFFNKAYEDKNIHLLTQGLNLSATEDDLRNYDWNGRITIASFFAGIMPDIPRLCIIDTPGVDAALHKEHSQLTHDALLNNDDYDTVIYVVNPTRLGTDAEREHLHWTAQNLQKKRIIFVLNKVDNFHDFSDSIDQSLLDFKEDLLKAGFENPVICPISAYFSYLIKLRMTGQALSEDEADEYAMYSKKFMRSSYDLSHYYRGVHVQCLPTDSEEILLSKRAGLYGLEKIIYGGRL